MTYEASLERNKIYPILADVDAERDGDLRVVDESGEDYLFSLGCGCEKHARCATDNYGPVATT